MKISYFLAASLLVAMCALPASARDHQGDHKDSKRVSDRDRDRDHERDHRADVRHDREEHHLQRERAEDRRDQREDRIQHEREQRWRAAHHGQGQNAHAFRDGKAAERPGWDHGKKKGWRGDDLPPGQAKKS